MSESKPTPAQAWREMVEKATPGPWLHSRQRHHIDTAQIGSDGCAYDDYAFGPVDAEGDPDICEAFDNDARLIVAQRRVAEALVKWIDAESDCRIAHDARAVYTRRTNEAYLAARERRARAADALYAACVAAVGAKL